MQKMESGIWNKSQILGFDLGFAFLPVCKPNPLTYIRIFSLMPISSLVSAGCSDILNLLRIFDILYVMDKIFLPFYVAATCTR
jgi:hypothetical protein